MDLEELRAFLSVVEAGSFLAAAEALGVSRTTLRRRVGALEARAGVPLIESTQQGALLTEAGRVLAGQGQRIVQEASALVRAIREVGDSPSGVLRVVLPVGLPPHVLTPLFAALRATYPRLRVQAGFSNDPIGEPLVDIDLVVHFGEDTPRGPWLSHVLLRVRERLVASKEYLERRGTPRCLEDLANHELFAWHRPGEDARLWPTRKGTTFTVEPTLVATDIHFVRQCCITGLGIGLVPDVMVPDPGLAADALIPVLPDVVGRELPVRVTVPQVLSEIPKIQMVLRQLRSFVQEL
jgi:DNA-binding transcriptional LysR family regulator